MSCSSCVQARGVWPCRYLTALATSSIEADFSGAASSSQPAVFSLSITASTISSAAWTPLFAQLCGLRLNESSSRERGGRLRSAAGIAPPRGASGHLHERSSTTLGKHAATDAQDVEDRRQQLGHIRLEAIRRRLVDRAAVTRCRGDRIDDQVDITDVGETRSTSSEFEASAVTPTAPGTSSTNSPDRLLGHWRLRRLASRPPRSRRPGRDRAVVPRRRGA